MAQTLVSSQATRLQALLKNPDVSFATDSFGAILPNTQKNHVIRISDAAPRPAWVVERSASLSKIQIASCADTLKITKGYALFTQNAQVKDLKSSLQNFNLQVHYTIQKPHSSSLLVDGIKTSPSPLDLDK